MVSIKSIAASAAFIIGLASALPAQSPAKRDEIFKRQSYPNGEATFYYQGGAAGSCGQYHKDSDLIAALSPSLMGSNHAYCGRKLTITNTGGGQDNDGVGKTVTVTVADTCEGCDASHVDLSTGAFSALTGGHLDPPGLINVKWHVD